ncbi:hypothetical protein SGCZBJ_19390 [Caulobacter zeae]|uniref:DUF1311 domain-containing protein n=1 Tax=Caulobacter zeae TaxID=2055137 RepID=A0A2N5D854_9CAUL|nr:hypothetical protein [Caulobacter zeae]PLR22245.1 hypothetical protein SGCZBJ_19390 [Caulobacter zeae]
MFRLKRVAAASAAMALALFHLGSPAQAQTCSWSSDVSAAWDAYYTAYLAYNAATEKDQFFEWTDEYIQMYGAFLVQYEACGRGPPNSNIGDMMDCQYNAQTEFELALSNRRAELTIDASNAEHAMNLAESEYNALAALPRCDAP